MKFKSTLSLIGIIILLYSCTDRGTNDSTGYTIQLSILEATDSLEVTLYHRVDGEDVSATNSILVSGKAILEGVLEGLPEAYYVKVDGQNREIMLFLENSSISINAHIDSLRQATISGSPLNDKYAAYQTSLADIRAEIRPLYPAYQEAEKNSDKGKMTEIDSIYDVLDGQLQALGKEFIGDNKDNILGPYQATRIYYYDDFLSELDSTLALFDESMDESVYVIRLKERLEKWNKLKIGMEAPVFSQEDSTGTLVSLADFRGKYVLVDFWASWCGPCRSENPNIVEAYEKYHDKGFEILGVSLDTHKDRWIDAIASDNLAWSQVSDLNGWKNVVSQSYGIQAIPYSMLIDPEGKIIGKNLRGAALHEALAKALEP